MPIKYVGLVIGSWIPCIFPLTLDCSFLTPQKLRKLKRRPNGMYGITYRSLLLILRHLNYKDVSSPQYDPVTPEKILTTKILHCPADSRLSEFYSPDDAEAHEMVYQNAMNNSVISRMRALETVPATDQSQLSFQQAVLHWRSLSLGAYQQQLQKELSPFVSSQQTAAGDATLGGGELLKTPVFRLAHVPQVILRDDPTRLCSFQSSILRQVHASEARKQKTLTAEEEALIVQQRLRSARRMFCETLLNHRRQWMDSRLTAANNQLIRARSIIGFVGNRDKFEEQRKERQQKERIRLLKTNDEEAYRKMIEASKNERLLHLLNQTDEYMDQLGQLLAQGRGDPPLEQPVPLNGAVAAVGQPSDSVSALITRVKEGVASKEEIAQLAAEKATAIQAAFAEMQEEEPQQGKSTFASRSQKLFEDAHSVTEAVKEQPECLAHGQLKPYQIFGLQWLVSLYNNRLNGILADEMGLGKTIQTIALIAYLREKKQVKGPHIVIVPLSTIGNWKIEFEAWLPDLPLTIYKGDPGERKQIHRSWLLAGEYPAVVLTTYDYAIRDADVFRKVPWSYMIVDEGHRLKNHQSKLALTVATFHTTRRLLLTGTPLQNNVSELWALLNFLLPQVFNSCDSFSKWFSAPFAAASTGDSSMELSEEEQLLVIQRLHKVLRPFLLRRLKTEVELQLPQKQEYTLWAPLSYWQLLRYNALRENAKAREADASKARAFNNTIMQLRKICNHPYLFYVYDQEIAPSPELVWASGKMSLLDRMLKMLIPTGHKILIFSQFTSMLDILEDFMELREYEYLRLDGRSKSDERAEAVKLFNQLDSIYSVFLVSTRAGGLGLNLQAADTVIIFDSDWNPQMDLQAQDRAHRIGQKNEVRVIRLATDTAVERRMLESAKHKLSVDATVIQAGGFNAGSATDDRRKVLEELLKEGALKEQKVISMGLSTREDIISAIARSEEETKLFASVDAETEHATAREWKQQGMHGHWQWVYNEQNIPQWFIDEMEEEKALLNKASTAFGIQESGRRASATPAFYGLDAMTESQFDKLLVEGGAPESIVQKYGGHGKKRPVFSEAEAAGLEDQVVKRPRRRKKKQRLREFEDSTTLKLEEDDDDAEDGKEQENGESQQQLDNKEEREELNRRCFWLFAWCENLTVGPTGDERGVADYFVELPAVNEYPDYYAVIKRPMDLGTIEKRLIARDYKSPRTFFRQMELVFENAMSFNEEGSEIYQDALTLSTFFGRLFACAFPTASVQDCQTAFPMETLRSMERDWCLAQKQEFAPITVSFPNAK